MIFEIAWDQRGGEPRLIGRRAREEDAQLGAPLQLGGRVSRQGDGGARAHADHGAEWLNRTINIDTGWVYGGKLTALRYPERELVSVPGLRTYYEPAKRIVKAEKLSHPERSEGPMHFFRRQQNA